MVVEYFETATSLWWILVVILSILMAFAIRAKSLQAATYILLLGLGILIVFGDTIVYLKTLLKPMQIVYGCGIYLIGIAVWSVAHLVISKWQADMKSVLTHSIYWPFSALAWIIGLIWDKLIIEQIWDRLHKSNATGEAAESEEDKPDNNEDSDM